MQVFVRRIIVIMAYPEACNLTIALDTLVSYLVYSYQMYIYHTINIFLDVY